MVSWIVTIPKTVDWVSYVQELNAVSDGSSMMWYRVPFKPKVQLGDRFYITYDGNLRGYMIVSKIAHFPEGFTCSTTGKFWKPGWYIGRTGEFFWHNKFTHFPGFRGLRKIHSL
jgi:hypothetical protein